MLELLDEREHLEEAAALLYSYAHVSLVFIKRFWEKLFFNDIETRIERLIVATSKGEARFDQEGGGEYPRPP